MLTLFTKAPMPKGANHRLLDVFGYPQRKDINKNIVNQEHISKYMGIAESRKPEIALREKELHVTVDSQRVNSVGLLLIVKGNTVYIPIPKELRPSTVKNILERLLKKSIITI